MIILFRVAEREGQGGGNSPQAPKGMLYFCMFLLFSFARHKMISRLQEMVQSHCAEAMSVLTATTQNTVGNASTHERHESVRIILNFLLLQLSHQCSQF